MSTYYPENPSHPPPFPASDLPAQVQTIQRNNIVKSRKTPVNLAECPLFEMVQYSCNPPEKGAVTGRIECESIVRLFRRCAGGLTVETTAWDRLGDKGKAEKQNKNEDKSKQ
ncbi:hypothetical protein AJ79_05880 [Helicocarpus griseus UAMH5409]|uniref:Mitochondrial export protein Som1 n=1 Tax=Helicocarpus griseus UAMH5409 TaxID=1447875 RepID=A0A2B7XJ21_9EURO|nr:hypothetical protein AJ79_05880 [Helicocarpus griseus UAMH5409]